MTYTIRMDDEVCTTIVIEGVKECYLTVEGFLYVQGTEGELLFTCPFEEVKYVSLDR